MSHTSSFLRHTLCRSLFLALFSALSLSLSPSLPFSVSLALSCDLHLLRPPPTGFKSIRLIRLNFHFERIKRLWVKYWLLLICALKHFGNIHDIPLHIEHNDEKRAKTFCLLLLLLGKSEKNVINRAKRYPLDSVSDAHKQQLNIFGRNHIWAGENKRQMFYLFKHCNHRSNERQANAVGDGCCCCVNANAMCLHCLKMLSVFVSPYDTIVVLCRFPFNIEH